MRELPALLALLPRLGDRRSTGRRSRASTSTTARAARSAPRSARSTRSRWCRGDDLTSRLSCSPAARRSRTRCARSTPTSSPSTRSRRRRRSSRPSPSSSPTGMRTAEIVNVESEHSAMSAAIGAALAGARTMTATSSQGLALMAEVVYIAASMRAPIVMALGNRALSGPINIHCDHSDSMLIRDSGVDPAVRRERAGGVRPDCDRAAARRAPRGAAAGARLPGRLHDHALGRAGHAAPGRGGARFVGDYSIPNAVLDVARPTTQGPFAMPDYYYEFRRQQAAAMEAARDVFGRARGRVRAASAAAATARSRSTGSRARNGGRRPRLDRRNDQGRRRRAARGGRARRPAEDRSFRPFPAAAVAAALARRRLGRRARPRRLARRHAAAPRRGRGRALRQRCELGGAVYGLGGRDLHPHRRSRGLRRRAPRLRRPAR